MEWKRRQFILIANQRMHRLPGVRDGKHGRSVLCFVRIQMCQFPKPCFSPIFLELLIDKVLSEVYNNLK